MSMWKCNLSFITFIHLDNSLSKILFKFFKFGKTKLTKIIWQIADMKHFTKIKLPALVTILFLVL